MRTDHEASLLEILKLLSPESSHTTLRSWIQKGRVLINGKQASHSKERILKGSHVTLSPTVSFLPQGLKILYKDRDLIVLEKPAGLLSVATDFQKENTAHALLKKSLKLKEVFPVHRLDQDTSGLMIFALSKQARSHFKKEFASRNVKKKYVAVCEGVFETKKGTWTSHLQEDAFYKVHEVEEEGKLAISHFKVMDTTKKYSLVELDLETGRKNQLRVHCQTAKHPILGDKKYGSVSNPLKRLCLHAFYLAFTHPVTGKRLEFNTPYPAEFTRLF